MKPRLQVRPIADADVNELAAFIARDSAEHAVRFLNEVANTYKLIVESPERWPLYGFRGARTRDIRKRAVLRFRNYLIFYRADTNVVEIVRVLHASRDIDAQFRRRPTQGA